MLELNLPIGRLTYQCVLFDSLTFTAQLLKIHTWISCQHRPSTGPVLAHNGMFMGYLAFNKPLNDHIPLQQKADGRFQVLLFQRKRMHFEKYLVEVYSESCNLSKIFNALL